MANWFEVNDDESKVVISSRIRLARNLIDYPFPNKMKEEESIEVLKKAKDVIVNGNTVLKDDFKYYKMQDCDEVEKGILLEKHLISKEIMENSNSGVLIKNDESVSVMINEEDHIRIQTIFPGFKLNEAFDLADKIDDVLEERLNYAYDERLGFLTSCPTNIGTGLRASIMVHLPALVELGYIDGVLKAANQLGLAVRGIYGENSKALGNIFQISNQLTLGRKEQEIIGNIMGIAKQIIDKELEARDVLKKEKGIRFEDRVYRSLGILKSSRIIDTKEAMNHLSNVKLGIEMNFIEEISTRIIDKLMVDIQPVHQISMYEAKNVVERDINRANHIRKTIELNTKNKEQKS
ncbi:protein arginine kinase [Peptostreptococcaceae bacterium AGR-M142]